MVNCCLDLINRYQSFNSLLNSCDQGVHGSQATPAGNHRFDHRHLIKNPVNTLGSTRRLTVSTWIDQLGTAMASLKPVNES